MTVKLNSGLLPPWIQDKTLLSGFLLDAQVLRHRQGVGRQEGARSTRGVFVGERCVCRAQFPALAQPIQEGPGACWERTRGR